MQGAAAFHLKGIQFEDNVEHHHLCQMVGGLSENFPDGTPYSVYAKKWKSKHYWQNGLSSSGHVPVAAKAAPNLGMERRIQKKIWTNQLKATPDIKRAHTAILRNIADIGRNVVKDIIKDEKQDGTNSQDVLTFAVNIKKSEVQIFYRPVCNFVC